MQNDWHIESEYCTDVYRFLTVTNKISAIVETLLKHDKHGDVHVN